MSKMDMKKFTGALQEPFKATSLGLLKKPGGKPRVDEIAEKLHLLLEHYGLSSNPSDRDRLLTSFMALSFFLARDAGIPGFQEEKKRGRRTKWDDQRRGYLVADMARIQGTKGCSATSAAQILSKKEPWKSFVESKDNDNSTSSDPGEALRQVYSESKNQLYSNFYCAIMEHLVENGKEDQWLTEVSNAVGKRKS